MENEDPFIEYFGTGGKAKIYFGILIVITWLIVGITRTVDRHKIEGLKDQSFESLDNKIILSGRESEYDGLELIDTLTQESKLITNDNYLDIIPIIRMKDESIIFLSDRPDSLVNRMFYYNRLWVYDFRNDNLIPGYRKYPQIVEDEYSEIRNVRYRDRFILFLEFNADSLNPRKLHKRLKFGDLDNGKLLHKQELKYHTETVLDNLADSLFAIYKEP